MCVWGGGGGGGGREEIHNSERDKTDSNILPSDCAACVQDTTVTNNVCSTCTVSQEAISLHLYPPQSVDHLW